MVEIDIDFFVYNFPNLYANSAILNSRQLLLFLFFFFLATQRKVNRESLTSRVAELVLLLRIRLDFRLRASHVPGAFSRDLSKSFFSTVYALFVHALAN